MKQKSKKNKTSDFNLSNKLHIVKRKYTPFKITLMYGDFMIAYKEENVSPYIDTKSIDFNLTKEIDLFEFFGDMTSTTNERKNKLINNFFNILGKFNQDQEEEIDILKVLYNLSRYTLSNKVSYHDVDFINHRIKWYEDMITRANQHPERLTFIISIDGKNTREYYLPLNNIKNFSFKKLFSREMEYVMEMTMTLFMENFYVRQMELINVAYKLMRNLNLTVRSDFEGNRETYNILKTAKLNQETYNEFRDKIKNGEDFTPSDRDKFYSNTD